MNAYILTNQKIPESKKTKDWHADHIRNYVSYDVKRTSSERREMQLKCWKAYTCFVDTHHNNNHQPITSPYGINLGIEWMAYPLVESKLEQMVGEFMTRGLKRKTYVINKKAQTAKLNDMFDMI